MAKINMLDQNTINKIAAGEVVERPASVVKELVENAIDAQATAITVEIKEGGIGLIRITDNGYGIDQEDIRSAFLRHSTSKIKSIDDLIQVISLGFRGEALASIASVATVELLTKTPGSVTGTRYLIDGGKELSLEAVGCPEGTTIIIRDLFYNTPVRKKFLKNTMTEGGYVAELMSKLALGHPEISFKFILNGKVKLQTSGKGELKDVIFNVYGKEAITKMIPIDEHHEHIRLTGYLGKPELARANRNFENYFINGRYVKSKVLMKAIEDAFAPKLILHRFPFVVLNITIEGALVDVNVHPTKMDVRFDDEKRIYNLIYDMISGVLNHEDLIPKVRFDQSNKQEIRTYDQDSPEPFETNRKASEEPDRALESVFPVHPMSNRINPMFAHDANNQLTIEAELAIMRQGTTLVSPQTLYINEKATPQNIAEKSKTDNYESTKASFNKGEQERLTSHFIEESSRKEHKIIGQLFTTYWIVEFKDQYYIIDQHAAHERVLYERLLKQLETHSIDSQRMLEPMVIGVSESELNRFNEHFSLFHQLGFEVEVFGDDALVLRGLPFIFNKVIASDDFILLLDQLEDAYEENKVALLVDDLASMACKAAVKANDHMTTLECHSLIDELLYLKNPFNCPHGRPTIISMTKYELEKKFKRIV